MARAGVEDDQVPGKSGARASQCPFHRLRQSRAEVGVCEVLTQLVAGWRYPPFVAGMSVAAENPPHVGERVAAFGPGRSDMLFERRPAAHPVLSSDGQLGVVKGRELTSGLTPLRLKLEMRQTRLLRKSVTARLALQ